MPHNWNGYIAALVLGMRRVAGVCTDALDEGIAFTCADSSLIPPCCGEGGIRSWDYVRMGFLCPHGR